MILFVLLILSVGTGKAISELGDRKNGMVIEVTGNQWWWDVRYANDDPRLVLETANEIHIPVGRPVMIRGTSHDVIHSFWVPNLHGKRDLIPSRITTEWIQADHPGEYRGQCAEFCGLQHAHMAIWVIAEPEDKFNAWMKLQLQPSVAPSDPVRQRGEQVFMSHACVFCHAIRGTSAAGQMAPDLTHFGSRKTIAAGTLPNSMGNLGGWITDPQSIKPGNHMATIAVNPDDLQPLVGIRREPEMNPTEQVKPRTEEEARELIELENSWRHPRWHFWMALVHHTPGNRNAVHRHGLHFFAGRWRRSATDALSVSAFQQHVSGAGSLQRDLHYARHDDDVPLRGADDGGHGHLSGAFDAGHQKCRIPAAQRVRILDVPGGRAFPVLGSVHQYRARCGMVLLRPSLRAEFFSREARRLLVPDDHLDRSLGHVRGCGADRDYFQNASAGHDFKPHPALLLVDAGPIFHGHFRYACGDDREFLSPVGPHCGDSFRESG